MLVALLPPTLNFGTVTLGQTSAASTVTLSNGTGSNFTIKSTAVGLDFIIVNTTCSSVLSAGASCTYQLSFRPLTAGSKNELFIVNNTTNSPLEVHLLGTGQR